MNSVPVSRETKHDDGFPSTRTAKATLSSVERTFVQTSFLLLDLLRRFLSVAGLQFCHGSICFIASFRG